MRYTSSRWPGHSSPCRLKHLGCCSSPGSCRWRPGTTLPVILMPALLVPAKEMDYLECSQSFLQSLCSCIFWRWKHLEAITCGRNYVFCLCFRCCWYTAEGRQGRLLSLWRQQCVAKAFSLRQTRREGLVQNQDPNHSLGRLTLGSYLPSKSPCPEGSKPPLITPPVRWQAFKTRVCFRYKPYILL